jgi:hypothetical protein
MYNNEKRLFISLTSLIFRRLKLQEILKNQPKNGSKIKPEVKVRKKWSSDE